MVDPARARKLAGTIQRIVARALEREITDPRLGFVTVTDCRVTGDLQHADLYYTVLGDEDARADTTAALESARGRLRSLVGAELSIRLTPSLAFHLDAVPDTAASLEESLRHARERDAELARLRQEAAFAGDADPYRHDGEYGDDATDNGDAMDDHDGRTVDGTADSRTTGNPDAGNGGRHT